MLNDLGLPIYLRNLTNAVEAAEVLSQTFTSLELSTARTYDLLASSLTYPGKIKICHPWIPVDKATTATVLTRIRLRVYGPKDILRKVDSPSWPLIERAIEDDFDSQPIHQVSLAHSAHEGCINGLVWLASLSWIGTPRVNGR